MKHLISLKDFTPEKIKHIIQLALRLKQDPQSFAGALHGHWLLMLFQKSSTRTRLSFEIGMQQLGGKVLLMDWEKSNFAISPIPYEARYVSRHVHLMMARLKTHEDTQTLAEFSQVPVINGCDDKCHPCQALADLMTVHEIAGRLEDQTITYVGIHNNVANSLAIACSQLGVKLLLVTPEINPAAEDTQLMESVFATGLVKRSDDLRQAIARSHFVYTDTWVDMEHFNDESFAEEKRRRVETMRPYQLNAEVLEGSDVWILHDMPIHPGYEISEELVDSPRSRIYEQAENRMYAQQALMLYLLNLA